MNHEPLLHGKKTPPAYEGKTTASHSLQIRAFMTKMGHFNKIPTPNRLGIASNAPFASGFHKQRKKTGWDPPPHARGNNPLFILGENTLALCIFSGSSQKSHTILEKILTSNRQKKAQNAPFASFFQKFSRGDHDPSPPTARE